MDFFKKHWKVIVIVLLSILFVSKCTSSGNYKRKYNKEKTYVVYVTDSLNNVFSNASHHIDSLKYVIKTKDLMIKSLEEQLQRVEKANEQLANRPITVKVDTTKRK